MNNHVGPIRIEAPTLVLVGPTAIGKTALTFHIAAELDCEIISMDSMQVYRYMDIGTAKPSRKEQQQVTHHLLDLVDPDEQYNAARFVQDCLQAVQTIVSRGKIPLITGGTGLYLSSLFNGLFANINVSDEIKNAIHTRYTIRGLAAMYAELERVDPESAARIHPHDTQRILRGLEIFAASGVPWSVHLVRQQQAPPPVQFTRLWEMGLCCEREILSGRIQQRSAIMIEQGLIDEVSRLRQRGYGAELSSMRAIGYRHVHGFLNREYDKETMIAKMIQDTRQYAKRQMTWFRKHKTLHWYDRTLRKDIILDIKKNLEL